ncbi:amidase [Agreia pratensis]|uniref:Amidase n=1 Tax=Agreia pratensis TaxID=150121 RepID=A0A1X7K4J2_9MICO|nr:amidase [Agreia pratensis]MBF4634409.1 amidase [Agreia pratensis]SMG35526.1 amidase [Agreia pratensis]
MTAPHEFSALEQYRFLQRGELGVVELTRHYLDRIEERNGELGAFFTVTVERALERARHVEMHVPRSTRLWGMPFADKDLWRRKGVRTTFGSREFADFVPEASDELPRVLDEAGGVSLGKTATPEFGMTSHSETLIAPPARNPWDLDLGPGGSSGGAAAAVAAGMLPFAPGSDGGGSIRIPAAACGLVGIKPSRGRVPALSGIDALGGLPVAGPIARSIVDAAFLLDGMIGRRGSVIDDHFALRAPGENDGDFLGYAIRGEGRFQIGVCVDSPWSTSHEIVIDPEISTVLADTIALLSELGHGIEEVALDPVPGYGAAFTTVWQAGAAQIRLGSGAPARVGDTDADGRVEPLTRWLRHRGRELTAVQLAEALAELARFERRIIGDFSGFDAVLTPTLALLPRPIDWYDTVDPERNFAQQVVYSPFSSFVNAAGLPAVTVPVGTSSTGLPIGMQLVGRPGGEGILLALARQMERRLRWDERHPPIWA